MTGELDLGPGLTSAMAHIVPSKARKPGPIIQVIGHITPIFHKNHPWNLLGLQGSEGLFFRAKMESGLGFWAIALLICGAREARIDLNNVFGADGGVEPTIPDGDGFLLILRQVFYFI
jgi:hypothetical protein